MAEWHLLKLALRFGPRCLSYSSWSWGFFFVAFRRSAETGEQDPKGLVEELRATGRVASRGEKEPPGSAAYTLDGA